MGWPEREIFADQQEVAIKNFRGIDKESFLSKTTKAYMAILGDGRGGIFCENSLEAPSNWGTDTQNSIQIGAFDVILTNPPYGSKLKIDDRTILSHLRFRISVESEKTAFILKQQSNWIFKPRRCFL